MSQDTFIFTYPHKPGFKKRGTSEAAAKDMVIRAGTLKSGILILLEQHPDLTPDEIATKMGKTVLAIRPRCSELLKTNHITEAGIQRINTSGKNAEALKLS
tara:strand:- start:594 stop:896 length:303 start_codon:yes stop_codon:yes gene_type:complete